MAELIFFKDQQAFGEWLEEHSEDSEVWVGYYKKNTGRPGLTWSSSVDVALCYGWIDGIRKSIDKHSYKIRFTPRKKGSVWSAVNVKKVESLIQQGKMKPAGLHFFNSRSDERGYSVSHRNATLPADYKNLIKANQNAWEYFSDLAPSYKRDSIWWVMSAKKEETRLRRLGVLISSSQDGLKIPALRK